MSDANSAADGDNLLLRLPPELLAMVLQDLRTSGADGVSALATLASTCKMLNEHVTPVLYSRLVLTRRNAARLFLGLPRAAPAKKVTRTKSEWDAQLAEFAEKYDDWFGEWEDMSDDEDEDMTPSELEVYSDSDPETDDEYAPDLKTFKKETACTTWVRRLELFKWTTRLDIVQVPTCAISTDLVRATKPWLHQSDWEKKQGCPPPKSSSSDTGAPTILFPNLERLSLSARAVRYLGGKRLFADESSWGVYEWMSKEAVPFMFVLSHTLGTPAHVCVTSTHERVDRTAEHAFRRIRRPAETIEERHVEYAIRVDNKHQESGLRMFKVLRALSFMRGDNLRSLTVHGIRHALSLEPGFEDEKQGTALPYMEAWDAPNLLEYRYMYLPGRRTGDTVERRVAAIMSNAIGTAPWLPDRIPRVEHVGVGNAVRLEDEGQGESQDGDEPPMDPDEAAVMVAASFAEHVKDSLPARFRLDQDLEANAPLPEDDDPALQAAYETAQATADEARVEFMTQAVPAALVDVNARLEQVLAEIKAQRDSPNGVDAATRAKEVKLRAEASRLAIVVAQEALEARLVAETKEKAAEAASLAADTVMFDNRDKRIAARYPSPLDRVVFTPTAAEAAPCIVCGGKDHGDEWTLAELLEHSYK